MNKNPQYPIRSCFRVAASVAFLLTVYTLSIGPWAALGTRLDPQANGWATTFGSILYKPILTAAELAGATELLWDYMYWWST
jgi:hypothetical protein